MKLLLMILFAALWALAGYTKSAPVFLRTDLGSIRSVVKTNVNYDKKGKSGKLTSNWTVNNRGPVNCLDGNNPAPNGYSTTQKNGMFIHCSNQSGSMLPKGKDGVYHPVSTGCLIIVPSRNGTKGWNEFNAQLSGLLMFKLVLKRN